MILSSMNEKDPICGMDVDPKKAETKSLVISKKGKKYYFCSQGCKDKFSSNKHLTEILLSAALVLIAIIVYYMGYMLPFMGIVFLLLSVLKLIDIKGFANMFVQYDMIAAKSKAYAHVYPFIELSLGLMYLFTFQIIYAAIITVLVMGVGAIGIGKNLLSKNKIKCACLGAKVKVPLTSFTLVEDIIMALMALMILLGF